MAENKPEGAAEMGIEDKPEAGEPAPVAGEIPSGEGAESTEAADVPRKKSHWGARLFLLLILIGLPVAWFYSPAPLREQAVHWLSHIVHSVQRQIHPKSAEETAAPSDASPSGESVADNTAKPTSTTAPADGAPTTSGSPASESGLASVSGTPSAPPAAVKPKTETAAAPATQAPVTNPSETASASRPAAEQAASSTPVSGTSAVSMPSKQVANLVEQIQQLQEEVTAIQAGQVELRQQLQARQRMELRNRLRWLSRPDAGLAQQAAIWGDIATLPDIDETRRGTAEAMARLAQDDVMHIAAWRRILMNLAEKLPEKLPETRQADVLPKSQNKYLAWLLDAFHLHHAPSESEQQRADLARQAMAMAQALGSGEWPSARGWRDLLAALHKQFRDDTTLGLPESLDVQQHLASMRKHAATWLEEL